MSVVAVHYARRRRFIARPEQWSIGLYAGPTPFQLHPAPGITNPILTADDVTDMTADFVADPFLLHANNTWHLFFEAVNRATRRGEIALATSPDGRAWSYEGVVLSESFHLSYPYVFAWNGAYYMVPESRAAESVRLYRATSFPRGWEYETTLLSGVYDDPSVFFFDGSWWMFVSHWHDTLHLFFADDLQGPWTEHPMSPIVSHDLRHARPAGRVWVDDERIIRFAQDCAEAYGTQVHAFVLTDLSRTTYAEVPVATNPVLRGSGTGWNRKRMHHVDLHQIAPDAWLASVDGYAGRRLIVNL